MKESEDILVAKSVSDTPESGVDVLIPFHRIDSFLTQAITSAQASKGVAVRVIAINDSQFEITKDALGLRSFDLLIKSDFKGNLGAIAAGLNHCESEFVAFLDSDDLQDDTRLRKQIELMLRTGADISTCNLQRFSGPSTTREIKSISGVAPYFNLPEVKLIFGAHGADSSLVLRLETALKYRKIRSELSPQLSDYPWLMLMILGGAKYAHMKSKSYFYRAHPLQISRHSNLQDIWPEIFPIWYNFINAHLDIEENISPNFGLLIAFPSSLVKVPKLELNKMRVLKRNIIKSYSVENWRGRVNLEILFGIREVVGRRGRTIKTIWVAPFILFQLLSSLINGNLARRNGG
jgi:glycosyltransferase involved in cell wall biosynthesis